VAPNPLALHGTLEAAFNTFLENVQAAIERLVPGDHALAIAECGECHSVLSLTAAPEKAAGLPNYEPFMEPIAQAASDGLAGGPAECIHCGAPIRPASLNAFYLARVAPLCASALIARALWHGAGWLTMRYYTFTPPGSWVDHGEGPSSEVIYASWARAPHAAIAAISAYRASKKSGTPSWRWVTPDHAFSAFDGGQSARPQMAKIEQMATTKGLSPPFEYRIYGDGRLPPFFADHGLDGAVRRLLGARAPTLVSVHSIPAMRAVVSRWTKATGGAVTLTADGKLLVGPSSGADLWSLSDLSAICSDEGTTLDDAIYARGAGLLDVRLPEGPRAPSSSMPPTPVARAKPAPFTPTAPSSGAGATAAMVGASTQVLPPPPVRPPRPVAPPRPSTFRSQLTCRTCGRPEILVRRVCDRSRLISEGANQLVVFEKKLNSVVVLMTTCGEHLTIVKPSDLAAWGLSIDGASMEARRMLPSDHVVVWRRISHDLTGQHAVVLAGHNAASITSDNLWIEAAIQATFVALPYEVKVECAGENVVAIYHPGRTDVAAVIKQMRALSKSWGLYEPIIPFTFTKKIQRSSYAAGGVFIQGDA
jgi:hypothetical protein